jgi:hypothetical protein
VDLNLEYREDGRLTLSSARVLFRSVRVAAESVIIRRHAYADHPERLFTRQELLALVQSGQGELYENKTAATAKFGSFLFRVGDDQKRECEIALFLDEQGSWKIVVIHAFRRV